MARRLQYRIAMKLAIPVWDGRVSPVLDEARHLLLAEWDGSGYGPAREIEVHPADPAERARQLSDLGTEVLICGAISTALGAILMAEGIRVIPDICGQVDEVLNAFAGGRLGEPAYRMPGCCRRRQRNRGHGPRFSNPTRRQE
jgi:predicted Fe-Mo cluster-binding NifX family protein